MACWRQLDNRQAHMRQQHANKKATPMVTLAQARANKTPIDWAGYEPPKPKFTGRRLIRNQDNELADRIRESGRRPGSVIRK